MVWTLTLKDFGPFKDASIEVRPLTIFIGRNSSGKSLLLRLMWALSTAEPKYDLFVNNLHKLLSLHNLKERWMSSGRRLTAEDKKEIKEYVILYAEAFFSSLLADAWKRVLGVLGSAEGEVSLSSENLGVKVTLKDGRLELNPEPKELLNIEVSDEPTPKVTLKAFGLDDSDYVESVSGLNDFAHTALLYFTYSSFAPFFQCQDYVHFLVDSRAGLMRYGLSSLMKVRDISDPVAKGFIDSYFTLLEEYHKGKVDVPKEFFSELGFSLRVVDEGGFRVPYVELWNGNIFPLSEAPSGVREALPIALALNSEKNFVVYIEEPEAHLHPRAQRIVAKMIANAVKKGKYVIVTTHSDYLLYTLSNLIGLYRKDKEAGLNPNTVSAYLLKRGEKHTEVERLTVDEYGISEEEFGKVAEEMLDERGKIYD